MKITGDTKEILGITIDEIYRKKGCELCFDTGYLGRIAVAEILVLSNEMKGLIEDGRSTMTLEKQMEKEKVLTLKKNISNLIQAGITDDEEYFRVSYD